MTVYPNRAGFKDTTTSKAAADAIEDSGRGLTLREKVLMLFMMGGSATADEVARTLNESILAIRPRVSELYKKGFLERTGMRRRSDGGHEAHVYRRKVG